ncbi:MAG: hypothetical protein NVS3B17_18760 [Vulcanimicrobiaceae bacterium]
MRGFINGIVFALALLVGVGLVAVVTGLLPAGADAKPSTLEETAAKTSLHATIARESAGLTDPIALSDENLIAGIKTYGANCAVCHGASDAKPSTLAKGFYIESPMLAKDGVEDDPDGGTFWKLKHGIRFSAMPAFGSTLADDDLWKVALFLKHMDKLPPAAEAAWKALPSVGS